MMAAIEVHNKPIFPYRYEVCVLLVINAWELLLKAYLWKFDKRVNLFLADGKTKDFPFCVRCVANRLGAEFDCGRESLTLLYQYRNEAAHFFWENLEPILYSLLTVNVTLYGEFVRKSFGTDLAVVQGLVLLPIGFKKPFSPVDFLTNKSALAGASSEVKAFIKGIIDSSHRLHEAGIEDSLLVEFSMNLTNEKRIKNADVIAGITSKREEVGQITVQNVLESYKPSDNPDAKEVRIQEDSLFTSFYVFEFADVVKYARTKFENFKQNRAFNSLVASFKGNTHLHKARYLDPKNPKSSKKDWYSEHVFAELAKHYTYRSEELSLDHKQTVAPSLSPLAAVPAHIELSA